MTDQEKKVAEACILINEHCDATDSCDECVLCVNTKSRKLRMGCAITDNEAKKVLQKLTKGCV